MMEKPQQAKSDPAKEREELLALLLAEEGLELSPRQELIALSGESEDFPLSFGQQQLWFLYQWEPESPVYTIPIVLHLRGHLLISLLQRSLSEVLERHQILRATFFSRNGQPFQRITPSSLLALPVIDLSSLPEESREREAEHLSEAEGLRPFDLFHGPALRTSLLRLTPREHIFLLSMHHIVSDGWSHNIFFSELSQIYEAYKQDTRVTLPRLPLQYTDYVLWQHQHLRGDELNRLLTYWTQTLRDAPALLNLPLDHPRAQARSFRGREYHFWLPAQLVERIKTMSRQAECTLFMTLLAAFAVLLARYSGQETLVIGTAMANRWPEETEALIGFFTNTLALRIDITRSMTFYDLLQQVRTMTLEVQDHQSLPFEKLVEELAPERDLSYSPLFQAFFLLQSLSEVKFQVADLETEIIETQGQTAKFDLSLEFKEATTGLWGVFEYNTDLFAKATIQRFASHLQTLLEDIVAHPQHSVAQFSIVTAEERALILSDWNATSRDDPDEANILTLFARQVEQLPDAIALSGEGYLLTYEELEVRTNQLAHYLRQLGVRSEIHVGLCMKRSPEAIVGLLGILKAGGVYVPIDPASPPQRQAFLLQDADIKVLLIQEYLLPLLPVDESIQICCFERDWRVIETKSAEKGEFPISAQNIAYMIYTSGSTGTPKGVLIPHYNLCKRFCWNGQVCFLDTTDAVIQLSSLNFDMSIWEIFSALCAGSRLVLFPAEMQADSEYVLTCMLEEAISLIGIVPSQLQTLLEEPRFAECVHLRYICAGGEAFSAELLKRVREQSKAEVQNYYGPTETTIDATFWICPFEEELEFVPIGRPVPNTRAYVLSSGLQLQPPGIAGELYLGGEILARGYFRREDLTAERFLPDPWSTKPGARLYKTGDLARYLSDGTLEFLGRVDRQIKMRGYRIELGEIETFLGQHPAVRSAAVCLWEKSAGEKYLLAYVVLHTNQTVTPADLQAFLRQYLPAYMQPAALFVLDQFPSTSSGKIDYQALPRPEHVDSSADEAPSMPRTPIMELLSVVWEELLGV
ncbi:MAG TPA: amino acid adenylation domain-containing protein, partial [Ktedonobacteraceae bacterium]